jgi:hypothetical protein
MGRCAADDGGEAVAHRLVIGAAQETSHKENPHLAIERIVCLADYTKALRGVADDAGGEYVSIGGLAVGAWADAFGVGDGSPVFSKDIDLRGTRLGAKSLV